MLVNLLVYIVMITLVTCLICGGIPFIILHLIIVIVFLSFCFLFGFVVCVFNSFFEWGPYARKSVGLYCNDLPSNLFDLWQHSFYYFAPHYRHCLFFFSFLFFVLLWCVCVFVSSTLFLNEDASWDRFRVSGRQETRTCLSCVRRLKNWRMSSFRSRSIMF